MPKGGGAIGGRRVLVTRARGQAPGLSSRLAAAGARVVEVPLIDFAPARNGAAVRRAIGRLPEYDHVVLTSANAARALAMAMEEAGVKAAGDVVAVGPATAAAVRAAGLRCRALPRGYRAAAVADLLEAEGVRGHRVLVPRAAVAGAELPRRLRRAGASVDVLSLYRTVPHPDAAAAIPRLLRSGLEMVTFTSGSTVRAFVAAAGPGFRRPTGLAVACIGPATAAAAREAGLEPDVVAAEHTAAGLAAAIAEFYVGKAS